MKKELYVTNISKSEKPLYKASEVKLANGNEIYTLSIEVDGRKWKDSQYRERFIQAIELTLNIKGVQGIKEHIVDGKVVPMAFT